MAPTEVRDRLLAAAIELLAAGGPEAVQARKLAAEIGASTMAVYTHFGGMPGLVDAIAREGFVRLTAALDALPRTDDPVADLALLGLAYRAQALDNPELYRVMFGVTAVGGHRHSPGDPTSGRPNPRFAEGLTAFGKLVDAVALVVASGRVRPVDPAQFAGQLWSVVHGYVLLEIGGFFGADGVDRILGPMMVNLLVGAGDSRAAVTRAVQVVADRYPVRDHLS